MSKHNNNLALSSTLRCRCGRYGTIGEWQAGYRNPYECPDCMSYRYSKMFEERQHEKKQYEALKKKFES